METKRRGDKNNWRHVRQDGLKAHPLRRIEDTLCCENRNRETMRNGEAEKGSLKNMDCENP